MVGVAPAEPARAGRSPRSHRPLGPALPGSCAHWPPGASGERPCRSLPISAVHVPIAQEAELAVSRVDRDGRISATACAGPPLTLYDPDASRRDRVTPR